jgi:hypothetical protein
MNIEEKKAKLLFLQKFFLKSFLLSFILLIIASFLCVAMRDTQMEIIQKLFHTGPEVWSLVVLLSISIWKILIIQFTLVPGLVIWGMRKCCKCNCENK